MRRPANIQGGIRLTVRPSRSRRTTNRALSLAFAGAFALFPRSGFAQTPVPPAPGAPPAPAATAPNAPSAKTYLASGDKAARAKDWSTALAQYQAAMDAQASSQALEGIANAQYSLKMLAEAYESYDRLLKDYGTAIGTHSKAQAQARLKELAPLTGYVSIRVNEAGADVSLDGKPIGKSPVAALIRVTDGPHKVDISKDGFAPVTKTPNVAASGKEIVDVQLAREATTGHLSVKEKSGQVVRVLVDGADVGAAPIDLEVAPGPHEVVLRSSTLSSPAQQVTIAKGGTLQVELAAVAASAHLDITTSDRKGIIFLDAKPVAEGAYSGDVAPGAHLIAVTREGYERYEKTIELADKQSLSESVTLKLPEAKTSGPAVEERTYDGVYGGLGFQALFEPFGGEGNEIDTNCSQLEASSCSTSPPVGGGLMGWFGYAWHPVGVEAFLAGEYDQSAPSATFVGATTPLENPLAVGEPRVEQFGFLRFGGTGAIRARVSAQTDLLRVSLAAGFGLSIKDMLLERQTQSNSGNTNAYVDKSGHTYVSPAISADLAVSLRATHSIAIALGVALLLENAGSNLTSNPSSNQILGGGAAPPVPLPTPAYHFASGAQTFIGPYLGLQFGP
jgi:PEGA domain